MRDLKSEACLAAKCSLRVRTCDYNLGRRGGRLSFYSRAMLTLRLLMFVFWWNFVLTALAAPASLANSSILPLDDVDTPTHSCTDINECRTVRGILLSCLSTVFLCTWTSLHLNAEMVNGTGLKRLGKRVLWTLCAMLAPEGVVGLGTSL